ncbi:MAG: GH3 auxin-responsive promoter family protein [Saprospiraceae bacterium]
MRKLTNTLFRQYLRFRMRHIRRYMTDPHGVQKYWFERLLLTAQDTEWGKRFGFFRNIKSHRQFANRIPIQSYDSLKPYIERMMLGKRMCCGMGGCVIFQVLWHDGRQE